MSAHDNGIPPKTIIWNDDVPDRIRIRPQSQVDEFLRKLTGTLGFAKRWGRYARQPDLIGFDCGLVFGDIAECLLDAAVREQFVNAFAHYFVSDDIGSGFI